jgi:hypothetical protein
MATFIKGVTDEFPQGNMFKPDYGFLTQVLGTKQGQYDRGFSHVKNVINSALNDPLTSTSNEEYRKQVFKKIQGSLKDISNLDLSNPANISIANSIVDPVTQDKEFGRDMALTKYYGTEIGKYNALKASDDPKQRALANDYSMAYMNYGINELKNAKRGDGSILKAQPKNFVPFEDVMGFLDERAKKIDAVIVRDELHGFYKIKKTNGAEVAPSFAQWAISEMKNDGRFNDQMQVMGFVNAENDIKQEMETSKVSRDQALQNLAKKIEQPIIADATKIQTQASLGLSDVKEKLELFDREYPDGVPAIKKVYYDDLLKQKEELEKNSANADKDVNDITKGGYEYIANNLHNLYKNNAMMKTAIDWGKNYASVTAKVEVDQDDVQMSLYKIKMDQSLAYAKMNQERELAAEKNAQDERQFQQDQQLKIRQAIAKGELPSSTIIGTNQADFDPSTPQADPIPGVDLIADSLNKNRNEIFSDAFDPKEGVLNIVVGGANSGKFYSVMDKVKRIANGSQEKLTEPDKKLFGILGGHAGVQVFDPKTPQVAQAMIEAVALGIHNKARKLLPTLAKQGSAQNYKEQIYTLNSMLGKFDQTISQKAQLEKNYENIAKAILNPDGTVKDIYEGKVKVKGKTSTNYPIFDLSGLTVAQRAGLDRVITPEFKGRTTGTTFTRMNTGVTPDEWGNIFGAVAAKNANDPDVFTKFASMNNTAKAEALGNEYEISSNPAAKLVTITVRNKNDNAKTATAPLVITLPYDTINTNPALSRLKKNVSESTMNNTSIGDFSSLFQNPTGTINAKKVYKDVGFDFTATGNYDKYGNYSISYSTKFHDPQTDKWSSSQVQFLPMTGPDDIDNILALDRNIKTDYNNYVSSLKAYYDDQKKKK